MYEIISKSSGKQVSLLLATQADIQKAILQNYTQLKVNNIMNEIASKYPYDGDDTDRDDNVFDFAEFDGNAAVTAVQTILEYAWQKKASDIHVEPEDNNVRVRLRIDGDLVEAMNFSKKIFSQLVSRMKVIGGLDIAEKRAPQDGRMTVKLNDDKINMRISTLPTVHGEKVVIRILGSSNQKEVWTLDQLNMSKENRELFTYGIHQPNGIVLVTGPTGSGKSTTVYAALQEVSVPTVNVVTVEDPAEKVLQGLNQVQVEVKAGLTFAAGLRSILRQDPDVIMIGEIRDGETASTAARAAITGHLVISTLHTNDASSAFMRLIDMGVEPYMIASSVVTVVAQRLVKKICPYCKSEYVMTEEDKYFWRGEAPEKVYFGKGCVHCNGSGFMGRQAVHEVINLDPQVRKMITAKSESADIKNYMIENHSFKDLRDCTQELVMQGITTVSELKKLSSGLDE